MTHINRAAALTAPAPGVLVAAAARIAADHERRHERAWLVVLQQVFRALVLPRATVKQLKQLPGLAASPVAANWGLDSAAAGSNTSPVAAAAAAAKAAAAATGSLARGSTPAAAGASLGATATGPALPASAASVLGSNVYSEAECVLLAWLTHHARKGSPVLAGVTVVDFDDCLRDGTVIAAVIDSHVQGLTATRHMAYPNILRQPATMAAAAAAAASSGAGGAGTALVSPAALAADPLDYYVCVSNNNKVLAALQELGLSYIASAEQLSHPKLGTSLPFAYYLYTTLPRLLPSATVSFAGRLGAEVVQQVSLRNPDRAPMTYSVRVLGPGFACKTRSLTLQPHAAAETLLAVSFTARHVRPAEGRLTLIPSRRAGISASVLAGSGAPALVGYGCGGPVVFALKASHVTAPAAARYTVDSKVYVPAVAQVTITNTFSRDATFAINVQTTQQPATVMPGAPAATPLPDPNGSGANDENNNSVFPEPFLVSEDSLSLKQGASVTLPVTFLPWKVGAHSCLLWLTDANAGEIVVELAGTAAPPPPCHRAQWVCATSSAEVRELEFPAKNSPFAAARAHYLSNFASQRRGAGATGPAAPLDPAETPALLRPELWNKSLTLALQGPASAVLLPAHAPAHRAPGAPLPGAGSAELVLPPRVTANIELQQAVDTKRDRAAATGSGAAALAVAAAANAAKAKGAAADVAPTPCARLYPPPQPQGRPTPSGANGGAAAGSDKPSSGALAAAARADADAQASLLLPATGSALPTNKLRFLFRPRGAGQYSSSVLLVSGHEIRTVALSCLISAQETAPSLTLRPPLHQSVTQHIPLQNPFGEPVVWRALVAGRGFSGPTEFTVEPNATLRPGSTTALVPIRPAPGARFAANSASASSALGYPVTYTAQKMDVSQGRVELISAKTGETITVELTGQAEEPLAAGHVAIACSARTPYTQMVTVRNTTATTVVYTVACDLLFVGGNDRVVVEPGKSVQYELRVWAPIAGTFRGTLVLTPPGAPKEYIWYTIEARVTAPAAEDTVRVAAPIRGAAEVEIGVVNPLDESAELEVALQGLGLTGPASLTLPPKPGKAVYKFVFAPVGQPGVSQGALRFIHPKVGEFWYKLELDALPPGPVVLPSFTAPGKVQQSVAVRNPLPGAITVKFTSDNPERFAVSPASLTVAPLATATAAVTFKPAPLGGEHAATIAADGDEAGVWQWHATGSGTTPRVMPETQVLALPGALPTAVTVRNPYATAMRIVARTADHASLVPSHSMANLVQHQASQQQQASNGECAFVVSLPVPRSPATGRRSLASGAGNRPGSQPSQQQSLAQTQPAPQGGLLPPLPGANSGSTGSNDGSVTAVVPAGGSVTLDVSATSATAAPAVLVVTGTPDTSSTASNGAAAASGATVLPAGATLVFHYPLRVMAEGSPKDAGPLQTVTGACRTVTNHALLLPLLSYTANGSNGADAAAGLAVSVDWSRATPSPDAVGASEALAAALRLSLSSAAAGPVTAATASSPALLSVAARFAPLRAGALTGAAVKVTRAASGEVWRFPLRLTATLPKPDDTVHLTAVPGAAAGAAVTVTGPGAVAGAAVEAYLAAPAPEFEVSCPTGMVAADGKITVNVKYEAKQHAAKTEAMLVVHTHAFTWCYKLVGARPKYIPPNNHKK